MCESFNTYYLVFFSHFFLATTPLVRQYYPHLIDEKTDSEMFICSPNKYLLSVYQLSGTMLLLEIKWWDKQTSSLSMCNLWSRRGDRWWSNVQWQLENCSEGKSEGITCGLYGFQWSLFDSKALNILYNSLFLNNMMDKTCRGREEGETWPQSATPQCDQTVRRCMYKVIE